MQCEPDAQSAHWLLGSATLDRVSCEMGVEDKAFRLVRQSDNFVVQSLHKRRSESAPAGPRVQGSRGAGTLFMWQMCKCLSLGRGAPELNPGSAGDTPAQTNSGQELLSRMVVEIRDRFVVCGICCRADTALSYPREHPYAGVDPPADQSCVKNNTTIGHNFKQRAKHVQGSVLPVLSET